MKTLLCGTHPHHCGCGACGADGEVAPRPDGGGLTDRVARLLAVLVCVLAAGVCGWVWWPK